MLETYYELMRRQGISRRSFLKFCSLTAASLGLGDAGAQQIAQAMQTKPRTPVIWLHGLECTCCTESFIRSAHPLAKDVVLSMISLDYDDTLMAAAGHQAEEALEQTISKYKGNYILAVEGNPPLADDGIYCMPAAGRSSRSFAMSRRMRRRSCRGARARRGAACRLPSRIRRRRHRCTR